MPSSIPEMIHGNFDCSDIAKCVLGLKNLDLDTYRMLIQEGPRTAEELGELLHRERSTAYRALQNLMSCGLVYRETKTIEGGGYFYIYKALDPCKLKDIVLDNINAWHDKMSALAMDIEKNVLKQP